MAKEAADASELEKLRLEHAFEIAKIKLEAEEKEKIRQAEEKARIAKEEAAERAGNRKVSHRAEKEAEDGVWETVKSVASTALSWIGSKIGWW